MSIKENIENAIASGNPVVVDYWRDGCQPCKAVDAALAGLVKKHPSVIVIKVKNGESVEADELFEEKGIRSVPTLMLYNHTQSAGVITGAVPASKILDSLGVD